MRGSRLAGAVAAALLAAALLAASPARAQLPGPSCPPDDGFALQPGECKTYAYTVRNLDALDATFFTSIVHSTLVVQDGSGQTVSDAQRDAFLDAYFSVQWLRNPWLSVPDVLDATRPPAQRTGGLDVLVEPDQRTYCGPLPITDEQPCRLGRVHKEGSTSLLAQPTDSRVAYLQISFSGAAAGGPQQDWRLVHWDVKVTAAVPALQDCPGTQVSGVCAVPVYER
jgi:hypothetical protein